MNAISTRIMRLVQTVSVLALAIVATVASAADSNSIQAINVAAHPGGRVVVKVTL